MLFVVVSKLPILSTTQETPKTQQIPILGVPRDNKLVGQTQTNSQLLSRVTHSSDLSQGLSSVISLSSPKPLPSIPAGPRAAQLSLCSQGVGSPGAAVALLPTAARWAGSFLQPQVSHSLGKGSSQPWELGAG